MKLKINIILVLSALLLFSPSAGFAQETPLEGEDRNLPKVRPFRIGAKLGFPNLIGGNLEYVTPLLGKKLAVSADYSTIKSDWFLKTDDTEEETQDQINYTYMEFGLNYYFFRPGKGLYAGVGYHIIKAEATTEYMESVAYINEEHSAINVKLGAKLGGLFYFRPEIGYSFDPLPKKYDVHTVYSDGTEETRTDDWSDAEGPADILFKGLMANIGFGFAF